MLPSILFRFFVSQFLLVGDPRLFLASVAFPDPSSNVVPPPPPLSTFGKRLFGGKDFFYILVSPRVPFPIYGARARTSHPFFVDCFSPVLSFTVVSAEVHMFPGPFFNPVFAMIRTVRRPLSLPWRFMPRRNFLTNFFPPRICSKTFLFHSFARRRRPPA